VGRDARRPFVLFLPGGGIDSASSRVRLYIYLPHLRERGIRWHIASYTYHKYDTRAGLPPLKGKERLWLELLPQRNWAALLRADIVFFQRQEVRPSYVRVARALGKRIVYDFDDALHLVPPERKAGIEPHEAQPSRFCRRLEWICKQADLVLTTTPDLQKVARQFTQRVFALPSVVDIVVDRPPAPPAKPVIGWMGTPENQRYLRLIEPALLRLQAEMPGLEVHIMTSQLMDPPPRFRFRYIPWERSHEPEVISQFTVAVAPLADDVWCRAKMNYKALVAIGLGVPTVVSPGGFPEEEFEDGRSVLMARSEEDWYNHLKLLLSNPSRRDEIARGGLDAVRRRFTAEARSGEFMAALTGEEPPTVPPCSKGG